MMRTIIALIATALVAATLSPTAAGQDEGSRQTAKLKFTRKAPGKPSGLIFKVDYVNPDDPAAKPPAVSQVVETLAPGARFDTSAPELCAASDPELMLLGTAACPPGSRVADGVITLDTGFPQPGRFITSPADFLNNTDEQIFLNHALATETPRVVTRARVTERERIVAAPFLPGTPPDGAATDTVLVRDFVSKREVGGELGSYITTPPNCPKRGYWMNESRFTYFDGVTQTVETRSPCRRAQRRR
ncbi:MAG: hypothetical protein ACRDK9_08550 [Solirubrobacterales bacterium]